MQENPTMRQLRPALMLTLLLLSACKSEAPANPPMAALDWNSHRAAAMGVWIEYPTVYKREEEGTELQFRYEGYPVVSMTLLGRDQAAERGLWARHQPQGQGSLGGQPADRYVYDHCDGPTCMPTISLVVPHRGRFLALDFRTSNQTLDEVQRRMADSVLLE